MLRPYLGALLLLALALPPLAQAQVSSSGDIVPTQDPNPSATWDLTGTDLVIGDSGTGSVTIAGSGQLISDTVELGRQAAGSGTLNLDGGILTTGNVYKSAGSGTVAFNSGTLQLSGSQAALFSGFDTVTISSGGAVIDTQNFTVVTTTEFTGTGGLTKIGLGTFQLDGNGSYAGLTVVEQGTFVVNGSMGDTTVLSGATFGGDGIAGNIVLNSGAILAPIDCFDATSLLWNAGSKMVFNLYDSYSDILELGDFTKGGSGTYEFEFVDGDWQAGQTYVLVTSGTTNFVASDFSYVNTGGFSGTFAFDGTNVEFTLNTVPEPSIVALAAAGLLVLFVAVRRKSQRQS